MAFVDKSDLYGGYLDGLCYSIDGIDTCLTKLFSKDYSIDINRYISAFGDTDLEIVKKRFENVIYELKGQKNIFL